MGDIYVFWKAEAVPTQKKVSQPIQVACMLQGKGFPMKSQFAPWMISLLGLKKQNIPQVGCELYINGLVYP